MTRNPEISKPEPTQIDPIFKQVLVSMGRQLQFKLETEVEVSRLPRKIDAIIQLDMLADRERLQQQSPFIRLRQHNQIEFKGANDSLYRAGYYTIRGRMYL